MALYPVEVTQNDDNTTSYTIPDGSIPINVPFSLVADPSSDFNTSNTIVAEEVTFDFDLGGDEGPGLDTNDGDGPAPDGPILTISVVKVYSMDHATNTFTTEDRLKVTFNGELTTDNVEYPTAIEPMDWSFEIGGTNTSFHSAYTGSR